MSPSLFLLALPSLALAGPMHPAFPVLDRQGQDVLVSGAPWSPSQTCGACHDTEWIAQHSSHANPTAPGPEGALPWETGDDVLGRWDPDLYTVPDARDLAAWSQTYGLDHVGGGPSQVLGVEMDCVLCHLDQADDGARRAALAAGRPELANTATLTGAGLVTVDLAAEVPVRWDPAAFDQGLFPVERLALGPPQAARCGSCHGTVHQGEEPLHQPDGRRSRATGMVYSGQRIDRSALNLVDKDAQDRSWDVHAERLLHCADCHYPLNHPAYREEGESRPDHLRFDPRKADLSSYLYRPSHELAKGAQTVEGEDPTAAAARAMRRCEGCHDPTVGHAFLPNRDRHFDAVSCETCHVPELQWTARQMLDWTALDADGQPLQAWRGTAGQPDDPAALHDGYLPVLLPRPELDGSRKLAPYNLSTTFLWQSAGAPVPRAALEAAWTMDTALLAGLDVDGDGALSQAERRLDTPDKVVLMAGRLRTAGVADPQITGFVDAWPLSHGVTRGQHVTRECTTCHGDRSRLDQGIELAAWVPGQVLPTLRGRATQVLSPELLRQDGPTLVADPPPRRDRYVFGADRTAWIDQLGLLSILGAAGFVIVHGGLRALVSRRTRGQA